MAQRVFVVDDLEDFLELMEDVLSMEGYDVRTFTTAAEAAEAAHNSPPDLIVTDLRIGPESGFDLVNTLRSDPVTQDIPLILCTAAVMDVEEQGEVMAPHTNVSIVYKPFDMPSLLAQIQGLLQGQGDHGGPSEHGSSYIHR